MKIIKQDWPAMMAGVFSFAAGLAALLMAAQISPLLPFFLPLALRAPFMAALCATLINIGLGIFIVLWVRSATSLQKAEVTDEKQDIDDATIQVDVELDLSSDVARDIASTLRPDQYWPVVMAGVFSLGAGIIALLMAFQVLPIVAVFAPFALSATLPAVFGSVATSLGLGIFAKLGSLAYREKIFHDRIERNTIHNASILNLNDGIVNNIVFDCLPLIGPRVLLKDAANLAKTCTFFRDALRPKLNEIRTLMLVQHVVYGKAAKAKAILEVNPGLLKQCATVVDYSGRTIKNATAYQAALGAMDVNMVKMIEPYFDKLQDGQQARAKQYREQYPNGEPVLEPYSFDALVATISASSYFHLRAQYRNEMGRSAVCLAINKFRADFKPGIITSGCHFNHQTLLKAYKTYIVQHDGWSGDQRDLFWTQAIGYIQRFLPACDAQAYVQGLHYITKEKEPRQRSFKYRHGDDLFFPLCKKNKGLGFSHGLSTLYGSACTSSPDKLDGWAWLDVLLPKKRHIFAELGSKVNREMVLNDKLDAERRIVQSIKHNASILNLNTEIVKLVAFYWLHSVEQQGRLKGAANLSRTCTFFRNILQPKLNAMKLLQHVVYGGEAAAKAMLEAKPSLLKECASATDYSGRIIKSATAYQAALGAMDVDMVKMIEPYFNELKNGEHARAEQYKNQYPNGEPVSEPYSFDALVTAISASSNNEVKTQLNLESRDSLICLAINKFRADFEPRVITSGCHFNHQTLFKAYEIYVARCDGWWSNNQLDLFWRQVIGYVQRLLPACDAQAYAQGLHYINDDNESLLRSFIYRDDNYCNSSIFPLCKKNKGLGFSHGVSTLYGSVCTSSRPDKLDFGASLKFYCKKSSYIHAITPGETYLSLADKSSCESY